MFHEVIRESVGNPRVTLMHCRSAFHDPQHHGGPRNYGHTGMTEGLEVTGEVCGSAASIVFG